jgi:hypothetical protein
VELLIGKELNHRTVDICVASAGVQEFLLLQMGVHPGLHLHVLWLVVLRSLLLGLGLGSCCLNILAVDE